MKTIISTFLLLIITLTTINAQVRIIGTDPNQGLIMLRNFNATATDLSKYILCTNDRCTTISSLNVVAGTPSNLPAGQSTWINGFTLNAAGGDLALYLPETKGEGFKDIKNMVDYIQWKTAGNEREKLAVAKGIWKVNSFISGHPSYTFRGRVGDEHGVEFWNSVAISPEENSLENQVSVHANKTGTTITIETIQNIKIKSYKLSNSAGEIVLENANVTTQDDIVIETSSLQKDNYTMIVETEKGTVSRLIMLGY